MDLLSAHRGFVRVVSGRRSGARFDKFAENTPVQNRQVLVAAYGELEADRLLNVPDVAVRRTTSFVTMLRRELGYTPAGR